MNFKEYIRVVENFPEQGIRFKDISTLLKEGTVYKAAIDSLAEACKGKQVDIVVGPEARGFVVGAPLAYTLGCGFVPVRKPGKLPAATIQASYTLEYGKDALEIHEDAIQPGQKVVIADDLLATGGTISTTIQLIEKLGGQVVGVLFMIELSYLNGREKLANYDVHSLIQY
ncbi:adenine phosphoribosyltransferase [Fodinisporobacter ferrooxydans]|uniref:Adenine phosphoribosyltransferase n=1 Tax=Fodinisporobacter ferrooxydans TaxID=2901836 RepID=A0ABY4CDP5_9BACL|nr:adenine phosphoribosyltransferase [Alicyclobacillaceae bacterium MYW30-H2]